MTTAHSAPSSAGVRFAASSCCGTATPTGPKSTPTASSPDKGVAQCAAVRAQFGPTELSNVGLVLCSPVARTMATARGVIDVPPVPVDDLYFMRPWRTPQMAAAESQLGYAPASAYLQRFPGAHAPAAAAMSAAVTHALKSTAADVVADGRADVLIVSHAGFSFLALEVVDALAPLAGADAAKRDAWHAAARTVVESANVGEVCGFALDAALPEGAKYLACPHGTDFAAARSNDAFVAPKKPRR